MGSKFAKTAKARAGARKIAVATSAARKDMRPPAAIAKLRCLVINLKDREDRWNGVQKSARKNAPWLKLERLDAVNGRENPPPTKDVSKIYSTLRMAKLFHWYRSKDVTMSGGERGCCASHLKA